MCTKMHLDRKSFRSSIYRHIRQILDVDGKKNESLYARLFTSYSHFNSILIGALYIIHERYTRKKFIHEE